MTCGVCKTDGLKPVNNGLFVCWCQLDLCPGCVEEHGKVCEWYQAMKIKPEKKVKVKPLPKIGRSKHMTKRYRGGVTA